MPTYYARMKNDLPRVRDRIFRAMYTPVAELEVEGWHSVEPLPFAERTNGKPFTPPVPERNQCQQDSSPCLPGSGRSNDSGYCWGELFDCAWFHFQGQVPSQAAGQEVVLLIDVGGELLIVDDQGNPVRGLTNVHPGFSSAMGQTGKRVFPFLKKARGGEKIDLWGDAGLNSLFGSHNPFGDYQGGQVAITNPNMRALYYDFEVLLDLMLNLPEDSSRYQEILYALCRVALMMRNYDETEAAKARQLLKPALQRHEGDRPLLVSAIGHAHIDLAWLWPIRETIRKGARTFATVLELMERYPDYVFGQSMPQLYDWMKQHYPSLYADIKKCVKKGRWEPVGALWVEPDTNLSGGEALVRQVVYGKRFFREEFGYDSHIAWIPDSFGYTGALPQIFVKCGIDCFVTQKLSWDRYKSYPHHTFKWRGIDGSEILTHLIPENTYNSGASPGGVLATERNYLDKDRCPNALLVYGIGDGGGGPGMEHLERLERIKDLAGLPKVVSERVDRFVDRLQSNSADVMTWVGELYLSCHQGTYTTQAKNKYWNRRLEIALHEVEWLAAWGHSLMGGEYPRTDLETIWKEVLLYQFHDILPGSSITRVHTESVARYEVLAQQTDQLKSTALSLWAEQIDTSEFNNPMVLLNTLSWPCREWVAVEGGYRQVTIPAHGYTTIENKAEELTETKSLKATTKLLENDELRVRFASDGTITSVYDKTHNRECIAKGERANQTLVYDDPGDAWDFVIEYEGQSPMSFELVSAKSAVEGPCAIMRQVRVFGQSEIRQEIRLWQGSRRLEFVTEANWQETHKMLRVAFPTTVLTNHSTSEIQFGHIKRPNHRNTVWEQSMFETCAHKWVDLSDRNYGVALLNNCKYGHKIQDHVIELNLLRSPCTPDPIADRGIHSFAYALYPHQGDPVAGGVIQAGYQWNMPPAVINATVHQGKLPSEWSLVRSISQNLVLETVKLAEDSEAVVLRFYEAHGGSGEAVVELNDCLPYTQAALTDLMEENPQPISLKNHTLRFLVKPFEVITIYLNK